MQAWTVKIKNGFIGFGSMDKHRHENRKWGIMDRHVSMDMKSVYALT